MVLVFRDVSEHRRLEAELQRRSDDLAERDRRKDEFLAMLRLTSAQPAGAITNSLRFLRIKYAGDSEFESLGGMMERQVAQLARLVDDLLDVSRITRGKFELRKTRVDLDAIMGLAVEAVRPILEERHHRLELHLPEQPLLLDADPNRLEQILANLLTNAGKYTPPGGLIQLWGERAGDPPWSESATTASVFGRRCCRVCSICFSKRIGFRGRCPRVWASV